MIRGAAEMKFQPVQERQNLLKPLPSAGGCGCSPAKDNIKDDIREEFKNTPWVTGFIESPAGSVPVVSTVLSPVDRFGHFRARTSSFRMSFSVRPGLYAAGTPDSASEVFVTANYKLSFDHLRRALHGMSAWILVLDTNGINVWCAAGKGTFGTEELIKRIKSAGLERYVEHRRIILPQLGAPGVDQGVVRKNTGFRISYGPVMADDIKKYVANGYKADERMRLVRFNIIDRGVLVPIEINMVKGKFLYFAAAVLLYSALQPEGIIFREALTTGMPLLIAGLLAIAAGAVLTPLLLPFIPFRSFALKGLLTGAAVIYGADYLTGVFSSDGGYFSAAVYILFPLLASYLALQFTGATTFTSLSGVKREIRYTLPLYIGGFFVSTILLVISKIMGWGYL